MAVFTRKPTDTEVLDWRSDPTLTTARQKIANFQHRLATLGHETSQAEGEMHAKAEALEDALLNELLERGTPQDVEAARAAYQEAQEKCDHLAAQRPPIERARTILQEEIEALEMQAMKRSLPALQATYADAVRKLREALEHAEHANAEVERIYRLACCCFPSDNACRARAGIGVDAGLEPLFWGELMFIEHAQDGGRLGSWRKRAKEVLNGQ